LSRQSRVAIKRRAFRGWDVKDIQALEKGEKKMAYDVIVLAGQSNAEGHGFGDVAAPYEPNENIVQLFDPQPLCFVAGENGVEYLRVEEPWIFQRS
jgi:hypothetical protein